MNVKRYDVTTTEGTATICTVASGKALTITSMAIVASGASGELSFKIGSQVIGEFTIDKYDTIYPMPNINLMAGESLSVTSTTAGIFVSASTVERDA